MKTKAAVLYEMGRERPYALSLPLVVDEISLADPGPGEVLVEIGAAGLCHSDLSVVDGSRPRGMPMVLGHEASGIVRGVGPTASGVSEFRPGDHVVFSWVAVCGRCQFCISGRGALCEPGGEANVAGTLLNGARRFSDARSPPQACNHHLGVSAFSQFTVAAQESLVRIDPALPLNIAALFGCAVMTGVGAVLNTARVESGASVAVFGMGGVGLSAVMGARAAGAFPIIAVDRVADKLDLARELGATNLIDASREDPVATIKELGGADYAFESVGSEKVLIQSYESTRRGGTTITIGLPAPDKMFAIPALGIVAEERTIKGSYMGSCVPRRDVPRYIDLYKAGILPVDKLHTHTLRLEDINTGFDRLADAQAVRQIIDFSAESGR